MRVSLSECAHFLTCGWWVLFWSLNLTICFNFGTVNLDKVLRSCSSSSRSCSSPPCCCCCCCCCCCWRMKWLLVWGSLKHIRPLMNAKRSRESCSLLHLLVYFSTNDFIWRRFETSSTCYQTIQNKKQKQTQTTQTKQDFSKYTHE